MTSEACAEPGCDSPVAARSLCNKHYRRAKKAGDLPSKPRISDIDIDAQTCTCPTHGKGARLRIRHRANGRLSYSCRRCDRGSGRTKGAAKAQRLRYKYGISLAEVELMIEAQQGLCLICRDRLVEPAVDHCHSQGHVRGILCRSCNLGLGFFRDSPAALERAAKYLRRNASPR